MVEFARTVDRLTDRIGRLTAWLCLAMVLAQVALVLGRSALGVGSLALREAILYANVAFIAAGLAYALSRDGHTRIDVFRSRMSTTGRAAVDLAGVVLLLLPIAATLACVSAPYVAQSWSTWEGSRNVGGLGGVFLVKSLLLVIPMLLALQGIALAIRAVLTLRGECRGAERPEDERGGQRP